MVLMGVDEYRVFALGAMEDIPQTNILAGDYLICDNGLRPKAGDIAIILGESILVVGSCQILLVLLTIRI